MENALRWALEQNGNAALEQQFDELDRNGDGRIAEDELADHFAKNGEQMPEDLMDEGDTDANGYISWEEFQENIENPLEDAEPPTEEEESCHERWKECILGKESAGGCSVAKRACMFGAWLGTVAETSEGLSDDASNSDAEGLVHGSSEEESAIGSAALETQEGIEGRDGVVEGEEEEDA